MFKEKDPRPVLPGCWLPEAWECLGESPASGHTMDYDSEFFCVCGGMSGGDQRPGAVYMSCFNALSKENVFMCCFCNLQSI